MQIVVNGLSRQVSEGLSVAELVRLLKLEPRRVAVERNKQLVPRARHGQTVLCEQDRLEIVTLVGGG